MSDVNAFKAAYLDGVAKSRTLGARNPHTPAEPYTREMLLAQCWWAGRLHDMPESFNHD
ncbi:hypothetical protein [Rhodococcus koreensis]|uniref:hypothetical protein n=1 Tax=Rhodococcus koreensis TaxID=99653 RepID=UPI00366D01BA